MIFANRVEAGRKLAGVVAGVVVGKGLILGIPRGGVVVAKLVAERLTWPLDVLVTKKIGFPGNEELAIGAVAEDGEPVWDEAMIASYGVSAGQLKEEAQKAKLKVQNHKSKFKTKNLNLSGKIVMIIDDGVATGRTIEAGIRWLRQAKAQKIIVAVPVCAKDTAERLRALVDEWICLHEPDDLMAVGQFYREFEQVSDEEVKQLLTTF